MIRLRELTEHWLRRPAVGPVLILVLAVALAFLVVHESGESSVETVLAACVTLSVLTAMVVSLLRVPRTLPLRTGHTRRTLAPARYVSPGVRPSWPYALRL